MKSKLHKYIIIPFYKILAKIKNNANVINIFDALKTARRILVLMPQDPEEFKVAWEILPQLEASFPDAKLTVIMQELYWKLSREQGNYGMIFVSQSDKNIWDLPQHSLINKVAASNYDIAIDLNNDFNLLSTLLCHKSNAPLRICIKDPDRDPFYNVSFRAAEHNGLDGIYKNLFKYLNARVK
ncbi:MAG: hypothetical protein V2J62_06310 [candidate division KSB1 bacterium]|jgi:ADP-heptose:LPS heptosyltransferase|nr:hypothetical protein [candidate division KSB1 bacterium]